MPRFSSSFPAGFTARLIARGNEFVPGTTYRFPYFPDGQATLLETAPGVSVGEVMAVTDAELVIPDNVPEMKL